MTLVTTKFKSGGLHEKHVVALGKLGTTSAFAFRPILLLDPICFLSVLTIQTAVCTVIYGKRGRLTDIWFVFGILKFVMIFGNFIGVTWIL
jgi:hypothetical protein